MAGASATRPSRLATGTATLFGAAVVNRFIDVIYRVALVRLVGAELLGVHGRIMPFFYFLLIAATAGIPAALVNLVAEKEQRGDERGVRRLLAWAFRGTGMTSLLVAGLAYFAGPWLVLRVIAEPRLLSPFRALLPALVIMAMLSVLRGLFQGRQRMATVAVVHLAEELAQVVITIPLLLATRGEGDAAVLNALVNGFVASEAIGLGLLGWLAARADPTPRVLAWRRPPLLPDPGAVDVPRILGLALPTTLNRLLSSVSLMLSAVVIPTRLMAGGLTLERATQLYGELTAMAWTLITAPGLLTFALAFNLTPAVAAVFGQGERERVQEMIERALWVTQAATLPFAALFAVWAGPVTRLAFGTDSPAASVAVMALGSPLLYWEQVLTGVLVGLGKPSLALINFAVGEATSLGLVYALTPAYGTVGAAFGWSVGSAIEAVLDHRAVQRALGRRIRPLPQILGPALAATATVVALLLLGTRAGTALAAGRLDALPGLVIAPSTYLIVLGMLGGLRRDRWRLD